MSDERIVLPCIPLRGLSVFPRTILHFDIGREKSIKALEAAMNGDKLLFVTSQIDENILIPTQDDYYHVGTVVKVKQMLKIQGDAVPFLQKQTPHILPWIYGLQKQRAVRFPGPTQKQFLSVHKDPP